MTVIENKRERMKLWLRNSKFFKVVTFSEIYIYNYLKVENMLINCILLSFISFLFSYVLFLELSNYKY